MLSTFLFFVFFSIYTWLYYKPNRTSSQYHRDGSADIAVTTPSQTTLTPRIPNAEASLPTAKLQPNEDKATVQIVDKRTPIPQQSLLVIAEEKPTVKAESAAIKPELVEAAVRDAAEKLEDFSLLEIVDDVSQVRL